MAHESPKPKQTRNGTNRLPTIKIDCSKWATKTSMESVPVGRTVNGTARLPRVTIDGSTIQKRSLVWIALRVQYTEAMTSQRVAEHIAALTQKLQAMAPELGLKYDAQRSEESLAERIVKVAFTPTAKLPDLEERLWSLLTRVRQNWSEPQGHVTGWFLEQEPTLAA